MPIEPKSIEMLMHEFDTIWAGYDPKKSAYGLDHELKQFLRSAIASVLMDVKGKMPKLLLPINIGDLSVYSGDDSVTKEHPFTADMDAHNNVVADAYEAIDAEIKAILGV